MTTRDLVYAPEVTTAECFSCKKTFSLYKVQNYGISFCAVCGVNNNFVNLVTLPKILTQIAKFAEFKNEKIDGRLVVDVSDLFNELQKSGDK